jgi:hypothetical protein
MLVLICERGSTFLNIVRLCHDLNLDAFISDIVEDEILARCALVINSSPDSDFDILLMLARLEMVIFLLEVS